MRAIYKSIQCLAATVLLTTAFAGCAQEHSEDADMPQGRGSLTLNIHSDGVGMRDVTVITDGDATTTATADEKTINDVTFGVFKTAGTKVGDITRATPDGATTAGYTQSFDAGVAETDKFAVGDSVVLAINIPAAVDFFAVADKAGFYGVTLTAEQALTYGTGSVDATKLPKFGKSVLAESTPGNYEADVTVRHLVAKVTLRQLTVDFSGDAAHTTHAAFTPEEIFLYSVPDKLGLQLDENGNYCFAPAVAPASYLHGETGAGGTDYLGTGALAGASQMTTGNLSHTYTLYTMPNNDKTTNRTRLVIKGKYTEDKDRDAAGHTAYYAVSLGTTASNAVDANYHYIVDATIKGDGAATVDGDIPVINNLTTTVTVADWEEEATAVTVDNAGYHYAQTGPDYSAVQIGDIIYADGYFNSSFDADFASEHGAPIAIVFSTVTTDYDKDDTQNRLGKFTHGYAMALKRANNGATTAGWCADVSGMRTKQETDVVYHNTTTDTQWHDITTDMEGLKHCQTARQWCTDNSVDESNLLAIMAAVNYAEAPENTTWYLPSIGQQYQWLVQFAKSWDSYSTVMADYKKWAERVSQYGDFYIGNSTYADASGKIATAINTYLTGKGLTSGTHFEEFAKGHYLWSSTERAAGYAFFLDFSPTGNLRLSGASDKSNTNIQVRAVLAF